MKKLFWIGMWASAGTFAVALVRSILVVIGVMPSYAETHWGLALVACMATAAFAFMGAADAGYAGGGYHPARAVRVGGGHNPFAGAGDTVADWASKHGWLLGGIALSVITVLFGYQNHATTADWITIIAIATGAVLCFAQEAGKTQDLLGKWFEKGLPLTWFLLSLVFTVTLWNDARNEGIPFWSAENWMFWAAFVSFLAAGITLFGGKPAWKAIGEAVGQGFMNFGKALINGYGVTVTCISWLLISVLLGLFFFRNDTMENLFGYNGNIYEHPATWMFTVAIVAGTGFFLSLKKA